MPERALKCPQCLAPLPPSRFAREVVCPYCGSTIRLDEESVPASRFRRAFADWNSPPSHGYDRWMSLGGRHWATGAEVARGEVADVYRAERARWPTERALAKILRDRRDAAVLDHEHEVLTRLHESDAPGAAVLADRLPRPLDHGEVTAGEHAGRRALVLAWAPGFAHTFSDLARRYPQGIEPRPSVWVWRRIVEILSFVHAAGFVHGAVLPEHLLVEDGEHGVRLVGFGAADRAGSRLARVSPGGERFYPRDLLAGRRLTPAADLAMSARSVAALLGGDAASGEVPERVPAPLAELIGRVAALGGDEWQEGDDWKLRTRLGELAREVFGPPTFCPLSTSPEEA